MIHSARCMYVNLIYHAVLYYYTYFTVQYIKVLRSIFKDTLLVHTRFRRFYQTTCPIPASILLAHLPHSRFNFAKHLLKCDQ